MAPGGTPSFNPAVVTDTTAQPWPRIPDVPGRPGPTSVHNLYIADTDQQDAGWRPEPANTRPRTPPLTQPLPCLQALQQDGLDPGPLQLAEQPAREADVVSARGQVRPFAVLRGVVVAQQVPGIFRRLPLSIAALA